MTHDILQLLALAVQQGASDLHLSAGFPPMMRLHGEVIPLTNYMLGEADCRALVYDTLTSTQQADFEEHWELDYALSVEGAGRFRGNLHIVRGAVEAAFRHIPGEIPELGGLGHYEVVHDLCLLESGLILVVGTTGSGKSTTLAAMIQRISQQTRGVIVTIEDPIEFILRSESCLIKQREVGADTKSFAGALRHILRQDPDVIVIGEVRDKETVRSMLTAAETGHLVFATLHTGDATSAISRIVDMFPGDEQPQVLAQIAAGLQAVICQKLLPKADGGGQALCTEVLVANMAVRACIRDRRYEQIPGLIEIGGRDGMHTFDDCLVDLANRGVIARETALSQLRDKSRLVG